MSIWIFGVTVLALLGYSAWMTRSWIGQRGKAEYLRGQLQIKENMLTSLNGEMSNLKEMYETRLSAKQEAIETLKKRLIDRGDLGTMLDDELCEEGTDFAGGDE